ncbi:pyridoxal-phosphate dependent enzyme [Massilia sp. CCM 9210]|uniref:pyridoxal-phosphate dependent enzyme n=1 Tax=Massilia scottii TaxID=3057166 RepID=UPI002796BEEA|nr:pyridoxal-phosphate dependent enzyme [Massilia sp. CCM 9210]MDQ1814872.1 pyridoxal-phosphate dependent enzyme [Massilia sp. CCM 9210]
MFDHIADAIKAPDFVRLGPNLYVARFETMKVYSTLVAVERLLAAGVVRRGDTLLDSSSGIYAYALALACHKFDMQCHIIASKTVDKTLMVQLQLLGANVEQVPPSATLKMDQSLRVARIQEIRAASPHVHWMQQYHDDIHYAGYEPIASDIERLLGTDGLTIVGGVGSGCSTGGLARALRCTDDAVELVGVQPFGSVTFGCAHIEDPGIIIAGIGTGIPFRNVQHALYDQIHWVGFDYGLAGAVALLRRHAIFAGLSSGCCYLAAAREAQLRPERNVLFIAPDTGHRYVDAVFAQHADALELHSLAPVHVDSHEQLVLPWSVMAWNRRTATETFN